MRAALLTLALVLVAAAPADAQKNPSFLAPGIPPPGANNPACRPAAAHPFPVIPVHGTFGDMTVSWNTIAPAAGSSASGSSGGPSSSSATFTPRSSRSPVPYMARS